MKTTIKNKDDIKLFVDNFYEKAKTDELLSPVFASRIQPDEWPVHLEHIYAFWNAILFAETGFQGNPMQKHLSLPITKIHFDRWIALFKQTIDELFTGEKAEEAKSRAVSIAEIMHFKISSIGPTT